ncbi:armadillo-type protein [Mycena sanguinolenta]|nr:armadillo-type protein [Mycena sanguinolenta]
MSSNVTVDKPAKDLVVRSQAAEIVQTPIDLWSLYLQEANDRAKVKVDLWKGSLKAFLLFAGLFAAVVSPFVIDSQARLQPTPSISTLAINFLWFTSLTLTLISALAAVLAQTWIVKFSLIPAQGFKGAMERWIRDDGAENWHLHTAITWITAFIQLSLFLFLAGFAVQAMVDHRSLGWTILSFVLLTLTLYLGITVLPWLNPTTPFRTPISELSRRNQSILLSEVLGLAPTPKAKNRGMWKFIQSIWTNLRRVLLSEILGLAPTSKAENRVVLGLAPTTKAKNRGVWKAIQSIWTNLRKTPDQAEVRLGICWSTLKDSSNNICIHAAVQELTKERINENQSKRLIELGLPEELSFRLAHPPAGLETTVSVVQRMKSYLHVIMWMVDECESDVARRFSLLIEPTDALLLALDALPSECRSLAFAIRVNLLLSNCEHGKIHGTEWTAMVDGLESNFAFDVCRTAFRGLVIAKDRVTKDFSHTRQDCARMLAAYIGSTRFSNEKLANSRITGDPLRIPRAQQDPIGHVKAFFSQLQEAWKRSMCTRAIRLMEDVHVDQQIMGFQGLSSVAENEAFREAVNDVLPELGSTLKKVDWRTSVACLRRVSQILEQDSRGSSIFRDAIKAILPEIIGLLSHSAQVRHAVLELAYQMDTEAWVIDEMKRITQDLVAALLSPDWLTRFASLQSLAELIEMDKIRPAIIGQEQNVIDCISFPDEDVRLAAIGTLRELAKHEEFYDAIQANMSDILGLVSDENTTVRAAAIGFVSEVSGSDSLRIAINRNIRGLMTVNFKSDLWVIRQGSLQFLAELLKSGDSYDVGIRYAFHDILNCLRDPDEDVGQAALRVISLAAVKSSFSDNIKTAIPSIWAMFFDTNEDVRVAALTAYSDIVKIQQKSLEKTFSDAIPAVLSALDHSGRTQIAALGTLTVLAAAADLTGTMPTIAKLFKADETDVRVAALTTCSDIAKIQAGTLQNTVKDIMPGILVAIESPSGWRTQVAALKTISTFAEIDDSIQTLNDNALDKVAAALSDYDDDVRFQALDTLAVLESKNRFRNKIKKAAVGNILPLLEDWRWKVRGKTLDTLAVFAKHGVFLASDEEIVAHIISTLSDGDTDTSRRVLKILFNVENRDAGAEVSPEINLEMLVATNSLSHPNWHVRVAGLQVLESFTDDTNHKRSSFPGVDTIVQSLSDEVEEVKLAGLRTWFKLIEHEFFGDRSNAFDTVPAVISSLLRSDSEDIRISVTDVISTYINKETFHSVIEGLIPTIVNLLVDVDKDSREDSRDGSRVAMLKIVRGLAGTEKFCTNEIFVKDVIRRILPSLLSERAVRLAALQIVPVISKHAVFNKIVADSLQTLLKTTARSEEEEEADTPKEVDDKFQAEVLQTLSHLATNGSFTC